MTNENESENKKDLGSWLSLEALNRLTESECRIEESVSSDSDSYTNRYTGSTINHFTKNEIETVAYKLNELRVKRYTDSKVNSYVREYSWGGYVWSPSGPVSRWTSGETAGFEVDGLNIVVRTSKRSS